MSGILIGVLCFTAVPFLSAITVLICSQNNRLPRFLRTMILSIVYLGIVYCSFLLLGTNLAISFAVILSIIFLILVSMYQDKFFTSFFTVFFTVSAACFVVGLIGAASYYIFHEPTTQEKAQIKKEKIEQAHKASIQAKEEKTKADKKAAENISTSATTLVSAAHDVTKYYTALSKDNYDDACKYISDKTKEKWQRNNNSYCSDVLEYVYPKGTNKQFLKPSIKASTITHPKNKSYLFVDVKNITFSNSATTQHKVSSGLKIEVYNNEDIFGNKFAGGFVLNPLPPKTELPS